MATREIVHIEEDLCDGCGDCVPSCAEGAIRIIDGKARLIADNLCDGLGACLGHCPQGAIKVEKRNADEFDEEAVEKHLSAQGPMAPAPFPSTDAPVPLAPMSGGCPGSRMQSFGPPTPGPAAGLPTANESAAGTALRQWPVQLHLLSPGAPFLVGADLLLAADCAPFAMADFHGGLLADKALAIACPKLDQGQEIYLQKLVSMVDDAGINTITVAMMEVPCCGGLLNLAREAVARAGRKVPIKRVIVGTRGDILSEEWC
ncbi:4Fe-4S ferredoxin [bacterium]|nr:MAG: 4Fe-4S ferredoxin [bacterium]